MERILSRSLVFIIGFFIGFTACTLIGTYNINKSERVSRLEDENAELRSMYYDAVIQREEAKAALVKRIQEDNR